MVQRNQLGIVRPPMRLALGQPARLRSIPRLRRLLGFEAVLCSVGLALQALYLATGDRVMPAIGLSLLVAGAVAAASTLAGQRRIY